jgi:hypothetical protein
LDKPFDGLGLQVAEQRFSKDKSHHRSRRTWRYLALGGILLAAFFALTAGYWLKALGESLVYQEKIEISDAILIENFDPDYLLFERTEQLLQEGWAKRVLVPAQEDYFEGRTNFVAEGFVQVMARVAGIEDPEIIPIKSIEPITLSMALQVRVYLQQRNIHSVIIVASGFRSRRACLIWNSVLRPVGIRASFVPAFGSRTTANWRSSSHGWQEVILQAVKLAYCRLYVLPKFLS